MIRGISRQIIEVKKTQNDYFERALLFVNPAYSDAEREVLEREAHKMLRTMSGPGPQARRRAHLWLLLRLLLAALTGAGAALAAMLLLH